jgi:hypothetical protein
MEKDQEDEEGIIGGKNSQGAAGVKTAVIVGPVLGVEKNSGD